MSLEDVLASFRPDPEEEKKRMELERELESLRARISSLEATRSQAATGRARISSTRSIACPVG